jgi:hypothetical protein
MNQCERMPLPTFENEDEKRLAMLGYNQEVKRIFSAFTNFGNYYYYYYILCLFSIEHMLCLSLLSYLLALTW